MSEERENDGKSLTVDVNDYFFLRSLFEYIFFAVCAFSWIYFRRDVKGCDSLID